MFARSSVTWIRRHLLSAPLQCAKLSSLSCVNLKYQSLCEYEEEIQYHRMRRVWTPLCQQVRFAGHSQWANRKHTKGAKDAQKARVAARITSELRIAIKEGGGFDPKFNAQLRRTIEKAKAADIPNTTIDNAIKQAVKSNESGQSLTLEARGPGNSFMVFEVFTDNINRSRQNAISVIKRCGGQIQLEGSLKHVFDRKGVLRVSIDDNCPSDEDAATELAIEIEAEDVKKITEEDGVELMEFTCDMPDFAIVKKNLEAKNMNITKAQLEYIPKSTVELEGTMLDYVAAMYENLEERCDVVKIYDNIMEKSSS